MAFAKAGERVMDAKTGKTICKLNNDLHHHAMVKVTDFQDFADGEVPWVAGQLMDERCFRPHPTGYGPQIFIEGEWRP